MQHSNPVLVDANWHYLEADKHAIHFLQNRYSIEQIKPKIEKHVLKYERVIWESALYKLPAILAIPGHLAAGIVEGATLAPLFSKMMSGLIGENILHVVAYLPILMFLGATMMVGWSFHNVNLRKDAVMPDRLHANWLELGKGIFLGGAYLFALLQLTSAAGNLLMGQSKSAEVILLIGAMELLLGYFTISGWQVLYVYGKKYWYEYRLAEAEKAMLHHAGRCEQQYEYYVQIIRYVNISNEIRHNIQINNRIEAVMIFSKAKEMHHTASPNGSMPVEADWMNRN